MRLNNSPYMAAMLAVPFMVLASGCVEDSFDRAVRLRMEEIEKERINHPTTDPVVLDSSVYESSTVFFTKGCNKASLSYEGDEYVKSQLRAPATAVFGSFNDNLIEFKDGYITYVNRVDSHNAFGSMMRLHFKLWMKCRDGKVTIVNAKYE